MNLEPIIAPSGWGFKAGHNLLPSPTPTLPDLPLLSVISAGRVTTVIRDAVLSVPGLIPTLKARDLQNKYGIGRSIAFDVLRSVRA
jgi:hypothetical protein